MREEENEGIVQLRILRTQVGKTDCLHAGGSSQPAVFKEVKQIAKKKGCLVFKDVAGNQDAAKLTEIIV